MLCPTYMCTKSKVTGSWPTDTMKLELSRSAWVDSSVRRCSVRSLVALSVFHFAHRNSIAALDNSRGIDAPWKTSMAMGKGRPAIKNRDQVVVNPPRGRHQLTVGSDT